MDRNMITVMTGQVVEFFDHDFRELYAISEKLDLFKEFHVSPPASRLATVRSKAGPKRPPLAAATTSRFQVSLGETRNANIQVPAHKYYNPKYSLLYPDAPPPARSLQGPPKGLDLLLIPGTPQVTTSEKLDHLSPLPSEPVEFKKPNGVPPEKKKLSLKHKFSKKLSSSKLSINSTASKAGPAPAVSNGQLEGDDSFEVTVRSPPKLKLLKRPSALGPRADSTQTVDTTQDAMSVKSHRKNKQVCKMS
ncbi:uncharacterized protein LOC133561236 [Nerophis ophidion]|uniref:uncharacterized protein LOC133561236 n=1 Tax=Nerophis ophidion TaxID=159077 RepID=UPI002ADF9C5B|nr:uncharacterized protein LOC133561236 [Nerophis ophidion]